MRSDAKRGEAERGREEDLSPLPVLDRQGEEVALRGGEMRCAAALRGINRLGTERHGALPQPRSASRRTRSGEIGAPPPSIVGSSGSSAR